MAIAVKGKAKTSKFVAPPWQLEDLAILSERQVSANWSEMGCYKTSTCLWLLEHQLKDIKNPRVLLITTKSGKGTYFEAIPEILPGWNVFNLTTKGVYLVLPNGREVLMGKKLAESVSVPHIIVTHYNVFAKSNKGKMVDCPTCKGTGRLNNTTDIPCYKCEGRKKQLAPWTMADYLTHREWDFVGLDEAHRIKNPKGQWVKNIKELKTPRKHIMTGTGFINRPDEIWSLLNFLAPERWRSYWKFREHFCDFETYGGYTRVTGVKRYMRQHFRDTVRMYGVRRTLTEVMPHIKEPIFVPHPVELNPTQRRMYDEIKKELKMLDQKGEPIHSPNVLSALNRMRQVAVATPEIIKDYYDAKHDRRVQEIRLVEPSSKLDDLMETIEGLSWDDEDRQQIVVFSCFKDPIELAKRRFDKAGISYIHMQEKDNDHQRDFRWRIQFPQKKHQVFICTLQLGSESINLSSAQYVYFLDRSWSPKDNKQGIGRVRRPGQEGQPVVINAEAKGTIDKRIENMNISKDTWFQEIFGDDDEG